MTASAFPQAQVWGGVAHASLTLKPDGVIEHLNRNNVLLFAPLDGQPELRATMLKQAFDKTPVKAEVPPSILRDVWEKFVFLATLASATCLMRANIGAILNTTKGREFLLSLLEECRQVAEAEGFAPRNSVLSRYREQLTEPDVRQ